MAPADPQPEADDVSRDIIRVVDEAARRATFTIRELQAQLQQSRSELADALAALAEAQRQKRSLEALCAEVIGTLERGLSRDSPGDAGSLPASSFESPHPDSQAAPRSSQGRSSRVSFRAPPPSTGAGAQRARLWRERLRRELQFEMQTQRRVLSCHGTDDPPSQAPERRSRSATSSPAGTRLVGYPGRCSDESPVQWPGP